MPKTRAQKAEKIKALEDLVAKKGAVFFSYAGLTVTQMEELRHAVRKEQGWMAVAKRKLLLRALDSKGYGDAAQRLVGPVAVVSADDDIMPARVVAAFGKTHEAVVFQGGILERQLIDADRVQALATLPSKTALLAKLVGSLQAPIAGYVNVLAGNLSRLVTVLTAVKDTKSNS